MVEKTSIDKLNDRGQKIRANLFEPLFRFLTYLRIRPNHITAFRLLSIPVYLYYIVLSPMIAVTAIIIGSLLDLFDGALARYQKTQSDRGKFWDVLVDHLLFVFGIFGVFFIGTVDPVQLGYLLVLAPVMFLLATIYASEGLKTDWIIHPYYRTIFIKPFGIGGLILYAFFSVDYLQEILFFVNIVMSFMTLYYVWELSKRWKKHE